MTTLRQEPLVLLSNTRLLLRITPLLSQLDTGYAYPKPPQLPQLSAATVLSSTGPLGHWSMVVSTVHSRLPHVLSLVEAAVWQTVVLTTVHFLVQGDVTQGCGQ